MRRAFHATVRSLQVVFDGITRWLLLGETICQACWQSAWSVQPRRGPCSCFVMSIVGNLPKRSCLLIGTRHCAMYEHIYFSPDQKLAYLLTVKGSILPCESLTDDLCGLVYKDSWLMSLHMQYHGGSTLHQKPRLKESNVVEMMDM